MFNKNERKKVSVIIPYCNRIKNIKMVLNGLLHQTMDKNDFEIIIGCLEYSEELASLINKKYRSLKILTVMSIEEWNTARARNLALTLASGEVAILIDADVVVQNKFLETCLSNHINEKKESFCLYQVLNYSEWDERKTEERESFEYYNKHYLWREDSKEVDLSPDSRFENEINIPWAMCWTGLVSFKLKTVKRNKLFFNNIFKGWGTEDLEWGLRAENKGIVLNFSNQGFGIHLPHDRIAAVNHAYETKNYMKLLRMWPSIEVEIVAKFGDLKGNKIIKSIKSELKKLSTYKDGLYKIVEFNKNNIKNLFIGAIVENNVIKNIYDFAIDDKDIDASSNIPLLGISIPYENDYFDNVYISKEFNNLSKELQELIFNEAKRVSKNLTSFPPVSSVINEDS